MTTVTVIHDFRLPPGCKGNLRASAMLDSKLVTHFSWTSARLEMGLIGLTETSVTNRQSTLRNIPEERRSQR